MSMIPKGQKPKNQFVRPGVDLERHGREWRDNVPVLDLKLGDRIVGFGEVHQIDHLLGVVYVRTNSDSGYKTAEFKEDFTVTAFVKRDAE